MPKVEKLKSWIVKSSHIEETVNGPLCDALRTATEIALIESEWPKKGRIVNSVAISRDDIRFTLTLETPDKPKV